MPIYIGHDMNQRRARVFRFLVNRRHVTGKTEGAPSVPETDNRWISDGGPSDNSVVITRDGRGRFQTGTIANPAGLYRKGRSGNPKGRPKGAVGSGAGRLRAGARAAAALLDDNAEFIAQEAIELVRARDPVSVRHCLRLILGVRRGQPVELALPAIAAPSDLTAAVAAITGALAEGRLTPDEALACSQMLEGLPRILAAGYVPPKPGAEQAQGARHRLIEALDRLAEAERVSQLQAEPGIE
jgi:hypothetical protein